MLVFCYIIKIKLLLPLFSEFVLGLAQIAVRDQARDKKLSFIFRIYDMDRDGYISNGELFQVLKMMTGKNLTDAQLQQIVDKTILYLDKDADGKISFEEFKQVVEERVTEHPLYLTYCRCGWISSSRAGSF